MKITELFCNSPRLLFLAIALITVAGLSAYVTLPRLEDPILTPRFATITTIYPGASADRVESLVTNKVEEVLSDISEIKELHAVNRTNVSMVAIELNDEVTKDLVPTVWSKVRDKLEDAFREMPTNVQRPEFKQLEVKAHAQLLAVVWDSESPANYTILRRLAMRLQDQLEQIQGTEKANLFGDADEEIVVEIAPDSAHALGLTPPMISQQIFAGDAKIPAGQIRGSSFDLMLEVTGEIDTLTRLAQIPIKDGFNGRIIKLGDIATLQRTTPDPPPAKAIVAGRPAVVIGVLAKDNYRLDWWSRSAAKVVDDFSEELPRGVQLVKIFDQEPYVTSRFGSLFSNFVIGAIGVLGVVLVMMGWRAAIVVGTTLPLSCMLVFVALLWLEIPLHQMSITGLVIAMGLLIDNAIVVVDEITRKLEAGKTRAEAILESVRFLIAPLIGSTVTTIASFAPIALMPGSSGEFVGSIAISTIIAVTSSFFLAVTVVPGFSQYFLKSPRPGHTAASNRSRWYERWYRKVLMVSFRRPAVAALVCTIPAISGIVLFPTLREQFFPPADRDQFHIELELPATASMVETESLAHQIRDIALRHSEIEEVHWFLGESAPAFYYNIVPEKRNVPNYGQALVKCRDQQAARQVMNRLQGELMSQFPQAHCVVRQLEQGPPFSAPIEVRLFGPNVEHLRELGDQVRLVLTHTPQVTHTRCEMAEVTPKVTLAIDENQAQLAGYDQSTIAQLLFATLEGSTGGSILEGTEEIPVRVRMLSEKRKDLNAVQALFLPDREFATSTTPSSSPSSRLGMPMAAVTQLELSGTTSGIVSLNRQKMNEVQAFIANGELPAVVLSDFQRRLDRSGFVLPSGYRMTLGGAASERDDAVGNLLVYVAVLSALMVATLVLSLQSFRLAAVVGLVILVSVGYSIAALSVLQMPFGFMAIVGLMGMIGVVVNDSIVVLASIQMDPRSRTGNLTAMVETVVENTRHVLATTLTTLLGFLPLALAGGEFWPPLAVVVSMGVAAATLLAVLFVPCCYLITNVSQSKAPSQS